MTYLKLVAETIAFAIFMFSILAWLVVGEAIYAEPPLELPAAFPGDVLHCHVHDWPDHG